MRSILVVFSIDLTRTFVLGVMGEFASFSGLKLRMVFKIRAEVDGLVRTSTDRVLRVASTSRASLWSPESVSRSLCQAAVWCLPAVILQDAEHPVEKARGLSLELARV